MKESKKLLIFIKKIELFAKMKRSEKKNQFRAENVAVAAAVEDI